MDKILYSPKEGSTGFWGLRDVPDEPVNDATFSESTWMRIFNKWNDDLESCKSNKLEIVNPEEVISKFDFIDSYAKINPEFKPGDIFDLPSNYEFKEQMLLGSGKIVLRLVKTETKDNMKIVTREDLKRSLAALQEFVEDPHFVNRVESIKDVINTVQQAIDGNYEIHYPADGSDPKWVKVEEKKLTFCDKCGELKYKDQPHTCLVAQPEPEESQENLLEELIIKFRKMKADGSTEYSAILCLLEEFYIQRKKQ